MAVHLPGTRAALPRWMVRQPEQTRDGPSVLWRGDICLKVISEAILTAGWFAGSPADIHEVAGWRYSGAAAHSRSESEMMKLDNKIALITGSDSGMGQAMTEEFAWAGAHVGISYHTDKAGAEESRRRAEASGKRAVLRQLDVRDEASVAAFFEAVVSELGVPDILVNDAGVGGGGATVADMTTEEFDRVIKTDLYGPFFAVASSFDGARRRGATARSSISPRPMRRYRAPAARPMAPPRAGF